MQEHAAQAAQLLKKMANEHRLLVLCALADGEMSVSELNAVIPLSQSALSQHLAALRAAGLVQTRRESLSVYYRLQGEAAIKVIEVLQSIYCPEL
ncbi:MAG: winged helix-turn-helix transcriptional regulator [Halioglobus sp.]|nr:winged helix-turn-helix transcriptional regulator [Halioglobus sp.]